MPKKKRILIPFFFLAVICHMLENQEKCLLEGMSIISYAIKSVSYVFLKAQINYIMYIAHYYAIINKVVGTRICPG